MRFNLVRFCREQSGAVVSVELVLVITVAVLGLIAGLSSLSHAIGAELEDVSEAFGAVSQSFEFWGLAGCHALVSGSSFDDEPDAFACDCVPIEHCIGHIETHPKCE